MSSTAYELLSPFSDIIRVANKVMLADRVLIFGVGKSAIVADLAASLLRSVGVPAVSAHATDVMHGDANFLPTIEDPRTSVAIGISHSGRTDEVRRALEASGERAAYTVSITSDEGVAVANRSLVRLTYRLTSGDGSRHGTIPTASVAAQLSYINHIVCAIADHLDNDALLAGHAAGALGETYNERRTQ